jgi:hypothetical protein
VKGCSAGDASKYIAIAKRFKIVSSAKMHLIEKMQLKKGRIESWDKVRVATFITTLDKGNSKQYYEELAIKFYEYGVTGADLITANKTQLRQWGANTPSSHLVLLAIIKGRAQER